MTNSKKRIFGILTPKINFTLGKIIQNNNIKDSYIFY